MIARCYNHYIARQGVYLQEQRTHDTLNFACLMEVASLLANRIELIEKQNALPLSNIIENLSYSLGSLAKVTANYRLIAYH